MARSETNRVRLEDSERFHTAATKRIEGAQPDEILHLILALRPSPAAPPLPEMDYWSTPRTPAERGAVQALADQQHAAQEDVDAVIAFAEEQGLRVVAVHLDRATVEFAGSVAQVNHAFGITLSVFRSPSETYRSHEGPLYLPRALAEIVQAVYGLDNRRMAFRMGTPNLSPNFTVTPLTPPDVAGLYGFPAIPASIANQTIAIFEFGGGYTLPDVDAFYAGLNPSLPSPKLVTPPIQLLGATNSPGTSALPKRDDNEVLLDIDVAGSVASGATIAMYFAPFSEIGWVTALDTAIIPSASEPKPSVISISWGCPEEFWSVAQANNLSTKLKAAAAKSITIFSASGDNGSEATIEDGLAHVNWPCIDPWVTAVGGTRIGDVSGSSFEELTWTPTGGGISTKKDSIGNLVYPLPSWQHGAGVPPSVNDGTTRGRGIPDIAAFADGYTIIRYGKKDGLGGTSEAAPLYAGLVAVLNAIHGSNIGYLNPTLYKLAETPGDSIFNDIDDGASNAFTFILPPPLPPTKITSPGYTSVAGWDACTGWGSLHASRFSAHLNKKPILATAIANNGSFGNACIASIVDLPLTINNNGFAPLAITAITSALDDFLAPAVSAFPLLVAIGDSIEVTIRFQPVSSGNKAGEIKIASNDPASPHIVKVSGKAVTPSLELAIAAAGSFGNASLGSYVNLPLLMNNNGSCTLSITKISSSLDDFLAPDVSLYPLTVAPGTTLPVPIRFAPVSFGSKSGTIIIESNNPGGDRHMKVTGTCPPPQIKVTGSSIFGTVPCGATEQRTLTLCNTGDSSLDVGTVALAHADRPFRLINNPFPATLQPGSSMGLVLAFQSDESGTFSCDLTIPSNDPTTPLKLVDVVAHTQCCEPCCEPCHEPKPCHCGCQKPQPRCPEHSH